MGEVLTGGLGARTLPAGTVTFLFTDLEGSTALLEAHPAAYREAVARHHALLREAVEGHGGVVFETVGDAVYAAFARPGDAVAASLTGQVALRAEPWGVLGPGAVRARMGLHTGEVEVQGAHYFGVPLFRCARLTAAAYGGQVVLSGATAELVRDGLPAGAALRDLGAHRLKDLAHPERVFQLLDSDGPADFPALRSLDAQPHNLPVLRDPLVGRAAELAQVEALLLRPSVGLLTLTGPGGTGKTRLALQAAANLVDRFEDGVVFAPLAPIREPDLVLPTVAAALGVRDAGARPLRDLVLDHLRLRHLLLLLDNFEQLLGAAPLVADLLTAAPRLTVLVTSRAVLRLSGEHEYPVPPLGLPGLPGAGSPAGRPPPHEEVAQVEAVRLFVERARAARPGFALDAANAPAVVEVCRRLDGLPLAIELAAARVRVLPPQALLARLTDHRGPAALRLLTGGARDLPARQQTLRATIEWSYGLLSGEDRALFRRLGVFVGGCTLGDAEGVALAGHASAGGAVAGSDVLEGAASLVEKSLLHREEDPGGGGEPWLRMLETVREYALEQLAAAGEEEAVRRAHAAHYLALAEAAEPGVFGAQAGAWLDRLEAEHDNLRGALRWALDRGETETALRLGGALWKFWHIRGHLGEGRRWLEEALAGSGLPPRGGAAGSARTSPGRAAVRALNGAGVLAHYLGAYGRAAELCGESLALARRHQDQAGVAAALNGLALVARTGRDYATARTMYGEAIAIQRESGDRAGLTHSLRYLGLLLWAQGDGEAARPLEEQALALAREAGDKQHAAAALDVLGYLHHDRGDDAAAAAVLQESLRLYAELGDTPGKARATWGLGRALFGQGDVTQAYTCLLESARLFDESGERYFFSICLDGLAEAALALGHPRGAARLLGAAQSILETLGAVRLPVLSGTYEHGLAAARRALGKDELASALASGRTLAPQQALAAARALREAPRSSARSSPPLAAAPRAAPPDAGAPLSAREREVARLIARGLSNKQIAAELVIAEGTAGRHVSNILGKLGFATRAQVAAWAAGRAV